MPIVHADGDIQADVVRKGGGKMATTYSVSLAQIIKEVGLETVFMPASPEELLVT